MPRYSPPHKLLDRFRTIRTASGDTLDAASKRTGMVATVIGSYERGDRTPGLPKAAALFTAYGYELVPVPNDPHKFISWLLEIAITRYGTGGPEWKILGDLAARLIIDTSPKTIP
jgi:transcriptional regulator with XRE-family HTH domain